MSEVYILEPPTNGKVILHTSHGDLDVELWAKECPKACRNFVQLCTDGYYDGTSFHRIIKDFIIQGGDPTGTGKGGESIYSSAPFPLEIHPRLKFRYRGLMALASLDTEEVENVQRHGSQFFITLARADFLNGKHTIFGKVLYSPFGDLHPRPGSRALQKQNDEEARPEVSGKVKKAPIREALASKKSNLLSFDEEEEIVPTPIPVADVPTPAPAVEVVAEDLGRPERSDKSSEEEVAESGAGTSNKLNDNSVRLSESLIKLKERVARSQGMVESNKTSEEPVCEEEEEEAGFEGDESEVSSEEETELKKTKELRKRNAEELQQLRKDILSFKKGQGTIGKEDRESQRVEDADLLSEVEKRRRFFVSRSRQTGKREREKHTISKLSEFTKRLRESSSLAPPQDSSLDAVEKEGEAAGQEDEDDGNWLNGGGLKFAVDSARAYELDAAKDALMSFDPLADKPKEDVDERMRHARSQRMKPSLRGEKKSWV